jgi:response regulator NasT
MLRILVIDESRARAAELCAALAMAGHQVAAVLPSVLDLTAQIENIRPDVILIETDSPSRDTLENLAVMDRDMPRPVIILTQDERLRADARSLQGRGFRLCGG